MKRCPQCEFIYEDDQSLCDMDGVLLVLDTRNLPNHHALATVPRAPEKAKERRNRTVPVFASLILALVLAMVYYVSTQRKAAEDAFTPPAAAATSIAVPEVNPTPQSQPSEAVQAPAVEEPKPEPTKQPAAAPAKKPTVKAVSTTSTKTSTEPKKDENKVGSFLKKTGRVLKKPFKF